MVLLGATSIRIQMFPSGSILNPKGGGKYASLKHEGSGEHQGYFNRPTYHGGHHGDLYSRIPSGELSCELLDSPKRTA